MGAAIKCNTPLVWGALAPDPFCAPTIRLPASRRDKPMHSERACPAPKLGAAADLGAQLKGDAVTHRNPSTLRKRAARSLVPTPSSTESCEASAAIFCAFDACDPFQPSQRVARPARDKPICRTVEAVRPWRKHPRRAKTFNHNAESRRVETTAMPDLPWMWSRMGPWCRAMPWSGRWSWRRRCSWS